MGNCSSFDPSQIDTAKLVVHDGSLHEFPYPVRVSYLLQMFPACFICDADDLGFDDVVTAVHEDEVLRPGQLYFALPLSRLNRALPAVELAALAVKACSALGGGGGGSGDKCGHRRKQVVLFSGEGNVKPGRRVVQGDGGSVGGSVGALRRGRSGRSGGGGRRGRFTAALSTIPE